jgi:protein phosphatase
LCHARPSDPLYGYCDAHSQEWASEVQRLTSDILLVGHTHTSFIRNFGERMVVNPGSVGQPKTGRPEACYAVWKDGEITLKSFAYPVAEVVDKLEALPVSAEVRSDLIRVLRTGLT